MVGRELVLLELYMVIVGSEKSLRTIYLVQCFSPSTKAKKKYLKLRSHQPLPLNTQWEQGTEKGPCGKREKMRGQQNIDTVTEGRVIGAFLSFSLSSVLN